VFVSEPFETRAHETVWSAKFEEAQAHVKTAFEALTGHVCERPKFGYTRLFPRV
jgi:hypothetical protein